MNARRALGVAVAVQLLLLTALAGTASAATYPSSMSATGDSITRAYNTGSAFADAPANSWSTGTNATVISHYSRLLILNPGINGKNFNDARSGAKMADLVGQMSAVAARGVDYVTVEMGGNDVCASSVATMTSEVTYRLQFRAAMDAITNGSPNTKVFVASVPDAFQLWNLLHNNGSARFIWAIFGICQSLLANPLSNAATDVARRQAVRDRNKAFNTILAQVCASYSQCRYDGDAVFKAPLVASDVSTRDYFHPSLAGQAKLAAVTWAQASLYWNWH